MKIRSLFSIMALSFGVSSVQAINYSPDNVSAELLLKVPGNDAVHHSLKFEKIQNSEYDYQLVGNKKLPLMLYQNYCCPIKILRSYKIRADFICEVSPFSLDFSRQTIKSNHGQKYTF